MRKSSQKGCYDNTGQKRKHADQWKVNDCKTCTCKVSVKVKFKSLQIPPGPGLVKKYPN